MFIGKLKEFLSTRYVYILILILIYFLNYLISMPDLRTRSILNVLDIEKAGELQYVSIRTSNVAVSETLYYDDDNDRRKEILDFIGEIEVKEYTANNDDDFYIRIMLYYEFDTVCIEFIDNSNLSIYKFSKSYKYYKSIDEIDFSVFIEDFD